MTPESTRYEETVKYLYGLQKFGIKLGLSTIGRLLQPLGEPHTKFKSVHIAGTNGKGSTASALASILAESGFKVGLFTSPHLASFTERIRINSRQIPETDVIDTAEYIRELVKASDMNPTFFEFVTAMAFYYFAINRVDWAVIETGMGGRLDATNVLDPEACIVTNISLDHSEFLGNSISEITYEKAGIIKENVPLITSATQPEVIQQLTEAAEKQNADIHIYGRDFRGSLKEMDHRHILLDYSGYTDFHDLYAPLPGKYQLYNACLAVRAGEVLRLKGESISDDAIRNGIYNLQIEGRLELVSETPPIFIDGAHNGEAARSLANTIKQIFAGKKIILVLGIMDDKDIRSIIEPLVKVAGSVVLTRPDYERAASPHKLKEIITGIADLNLDAKTLTVTGTISEAIEQARSECGKESVILVTGSFYTTGAVKELLGYRTVMQHLREH